MPTIVVPIPGLRVISEQNQREHWAKAKRRHGQQQLAVRIALTAVSDADRKAIREAKSVRVSFIRLGGRRMDQSNLVGGFKWIEDAVSKWAGVDDGSSRWVPTWSQQAGETGVVISIECD